jgi:hypothetical protein
VHEIFVGMWDGLFVQSKPSLHYLKMRSGWMVLTTSSLGTGFIVRVVTVIVFAIFPTLVTIPVLISGILTSDCI